ncbi:BhlA/UviB family holin-like peptide [Clostridium perfringens]|uniref:BhlA/UviB family holin-like peptide n=1 Tax=Clostridium perfringens TaxID=1502 RepID=UPI001C845168
MLFLWFFFKTIKKYEEREDKLYVVINSLTEKFNIVSDIKEVKNDVEDIKKT